MSLKHTKKCMYAISGKRNHSMEAEFGGSREGWVSVVVFWGVGGSVEGFEGFFCLLGVFLGEEL